MTELQHEPRERSRKALAAVLQALQEPGTQKALAVALGTSESTLSRIKTEKLEDALTLVYQLGFKLVPSDRACVRRDAVEFLRQIAANVLSNEDSAWQALGDE